MYPVNGSSSIHTHILSFNNVFNQILIIGVLKYTEVSCFQLF